MARRDLKLIGITAAFFVATLLVVLTFVPRLLYPDLTPSDLSGIGAADTRIQLKQQQAQLQNSVRSTLLQAIGGLFVIAGAAVAWRQVQVTREGHVTDRFTHAIDQLGSEKLDVRVGGLYALERIARDSPSDQSAIAEVVATFLRSRVPWNAGDERHPDPHPTPAVDGDLPWLQNRAADVHAAIGILGRIPKDRLVIRLTLSRLDLRQAYLSGSRLVGSNLRESNLASSWARRANWDNCDLVRIDLRRANLDGASLNRAELRDAYLDEASLRGAKLVGANLTGSSMRNVDLRGADLKEAIFDRVDLCGANLDDCQITADQLVNCQSDVTTVWPVNWRGIGNGTASI